MGNRVPRSRVSPSDPYVAGFLARYERWVRNLNHYCWNEDLSFSHSSAAATEEAVHSWNRV